MPQLMMSAEQAEAVVKPGWLALYRGSGFVSRWIQYSTGGPYSHAAMIDRVNGHAEVLEIREWIGPRILPLAAHAARWPGRIDIFSPCMVRAADYHGPAAADWMRRLCLSDYNYVGIGLLALRKIWGMRRLFPLTITDDDTPRQANAMFCSEAVANAVQFGGGVDCVPRKPNAFISPNDLAWSMMWRHRFTI